MRKRAASNKRPAGTGKDQPLQALRFIAILTIGGLILMGVRALDPWILDRVAIYVGLSYAGLALIAATIGLLRL